ncbi:MAG: hypothetical protein NC253_05185 [Ruminococcus sp.]|nr:hypothetical protein [Ruminococcus sp.]MCM1381909.1 hypothetical protein [Muribaculaceae bacterium]MCM1478362.1 hypothetical protein [Muribaculaceae bacterium]
MDKKDLVRSLNIVLLTGAIIFTGLSLFGKKSNKEKKNSLIAALFCMSLSNMLNTFRNYGESED